MAFCLIAASAGPVPAGAESEEYGMFVTLKSGGSSDVRLCVEKEKMRAEHGLADIAAFRSFFEDYIAILNGYSDDVDVLKIKGYEEGETSYTVRMATRRLDKIGGLGDIYYRLGSTYASFTDQMEAIEGYYSGVRGRVTTTVYPRTQDGRTQKTYVLSRGENAGYRISAVRYAEEGSSAQEYEVFYKYLSGTKNRVVSFKSAQFLFTEKIVIRLDGKLRYLSSEGVEALDERTLLLTPRNVVDSEGNELSLWLGYFVYDPDLSPFAIGAICVLSAAALGGFVWLAVRYRWFSLIAARLRRRRSEKEEV